MVLMGPYPTRTGLTVTIEVKRRGGLRHACILVCRAMGITVTSSTLIGLNRSLVVSVEATRKQKHLSRRYQERLSEAHGMLAFS
jgi:hypothetical protein